MASSSRSKASTKGRPQPKHGKKTAVRPSRLLTRRRPTCRATSPESIGAVISASFSMDWNLDADSGCMANPALGGGSLLDVSAYPSLWAMLLLHRHPLNTDKKDPEILVTHQTIYPRSEHQLMTLRAILMTVKFFKFCHSPGWRNPSLGGLGLLSFKDVAPLAYRSACESADKLLGTLSLIPATEEPPPHTTQRSWCAELWDAQRDAILLGLNDTQRKRLTENASKLGRSWLSTIPLYQPLRLSDIDIASALHGRPLVNGAIIEIEPPALSGQRRNDLRIRGTSSLPFTDYDLKVLLLGDNKARSTAVPHPPNSKLADSASTGGLTSHETADELKAWREAMPEGVFLRQQRRISVELVKARARTLVL
ncbi:hypothetical protein C356_05200 [Cryptococcus neoformans c45]|nr:hypothetical protein C356_05200 [Cryptococcus neoformans var. grubii c45]